MEFFDLISLLYAFLGVRALWTLARNWRAFTDDELTAFDRRLASEIAFFVFIPIGVFLHELGHALATLQVGGQVVEFHYAFFYGYVVPRGNFTLLQNWWISLAGNLVSIVFGFIPLALLPLTRQVWIKYTMLALARIQLGWALVGYPLLTLAGFHGDWRTIYGTSWLLTIPTFIIHVSLVLVLWRLDRSAFVKRWEVSLFAGAAEPLRQLDAAIAAQPHALDPLIARGNFFAAQDQFGLALADYRAALKIDPQNSRALYNIGQICLIQKRYTDGEKNFRAALARVSDPKLGARIHFGLGLCIYHHHGARHALPEFDAAILRDATVAEFYFWRGTARRALGDETNAQLDFAKAQELTGDSETVKQ